MGMFGMLDHEFRVALAREHADMLKDVMRASRRSRRAKGHEDETGRLESAPPGAIPQASQLHAHRRMVA